jgi:hypothetical protein
MIETEIEINPRFSLCRFNSTLFSSCVDIECSFVSVVLFAACGIRCWRLIFVMYGWNRH